MMVMLLLGVNIDITSSQKMEKISSRDFLKTLVKSKFVGISL